MTMPGFTTNQPLSGQQLGDALFQFLPALPGEGPPGMPRALARALFPQGFPGRFPAAAPLIPPVTAPAAAQPAANQVVRTQAMPQPAATRPQPAPQPRGYRSAAQGGEAIQASSQRIKIAERGRGL